MNHSISPPCSIADLFTRQAALTPEAVAVQAGEQRLTYQALNRRANQLGGYLQSLGIGPGRPVAICLERSPELLIAILGVMKAGGAYVPLDPAYPDQRLSYMLEDSAAQVLITRSGLQPELVRFAGQWVLLDEPQAFQQHSPDDLPPAAQADDLAYIMYTSGSTGQPKGVMVEQRGWLNYAPQAARTFGLEPGARALQFASISWDTSAEEIFPCLVSGATLVLRSAEMADSIQRFLENCAAWEITHLTLPTAFWHELVTQLHEQGLRLPGSLRVVNIGGERARGEIYAQWRRLAPPELRLFNTYGQTECTAVTTCAELGGDLAGGVVPLGRPVENVQVYLLDETLQPAPDGQPGELYVGGAGVGGGYLNRPELTAEKFIANPFGSGRLYRTGDLVRRMSSGGLEFVGRVDQQVKLRGIRIEPGEIETALAQHPQVRLAAVVGVPPGPTPDYLAGYVVRSRGAATSAAELRAWLGERLPNFMLPAAIVFIETLPLTPNGKLDRAALPEPDFAAPAANQAALSDTQARLAEIWQEVLGLPAVGLDDDFFLLGGHSLLATRVIARVQQRFNLDLPLRALFEAPTLAGLSERLESLAGAAGANSGERPPALERRAPHDPLYLSFAQESLWFLDLMNPGNATFNISDAIRLRGPLDTVALQRALNRLVARHEALRTRFENLDGQPRPVIAERLEIDLPLVDLSRLEQDKRTAEALRLGAEATLEPFDLQRGPLLRALLARLGPDDHILIVMTHHIISDGWSIAIFFKELSALYAGMLRGGEHGLPPLPVQFADYALWQRRYLQGERREAALGYWRKTLKDAAPLQFPLDHPRSALRSFRGARLPVRFPAEFTARLLAFGRAADSTLFMVLLAALQATLARYTGQTDITVGTAIANRHQPELDGLIGMFINTLVLRSDLDGNPTFRELLGRVRENTLGAYAHQALPFELIVQALHPQRAANRHPFTDVMLFLQNVPPPRLELPGGAAEFIELEQRTTGFDFAFDLTETPEGLQGFCEYDTELFDERTLARLIEHFQTLLASAIQHPDEPLASLAMLTPAERRQLLVDWNQTGRDYAIPGGAAATLPDLFELQAARTPDRIAVRCREQALSYAELERRANRLAHHLQNCGVGCESIVGVYLERSIEMVVAVLGILKAGAAYLPLDPSYPLERLQFMLGDAQAGWLVIDPTQRGKFSAYTGQAIDMTDGRLAELADTPPARRVSGENACYITYTSGSTVRPKGVVGLHRAALNRLSWGWETYPYRPDEVMCQKTALSFVDAVWEIFSSLLAGVPLVVIPDEALKDTRRFVETLASERVSRLVLVPSLLRLMLDMFSDLNRRLPQLTYWAASGEALPPELAEQFTRQMPGCLLLNLYGMSEAAADSLYYEIRQPGTPVRVGRPIANTQVYLLDSHLQPVPVGVTGEIYVGGLGLARGYWQRPDLTAERFLPDPFSSDPAARLYKTGDLGRYWPDGMIEYLGRSDFQVKIRGFRIELGEIQNVLLGHPAVKQVRVIAIPAAVGSADGPRLAAYIVLNEGTPASQAELRKFAAASLPEYMLPSAWVFLEAFPLTPSGKVDQRSLPLPSSAAGLESVQSYAPPRDELELRLVKLWEHLLKRAPVGIHDNFFEIGGHSLLVVRLMTGLERELGKTLSLALIFHAPTIAQMGEALRDQGWRPAWSSLVPIRPQGALPPLFCVHADGGAFFYARFADYLSPEQPFYGLQARGLDGVEPPFTRVEDMAAHYLAEMRTIQPCGPYIISGFSMGGVVIYEMARQSVAAGDPAPLVVFLDAPSPAYFEEQDTRLSGKLDNLKRMGFDERMQRVQHRLGQRYRWWSSELLSRLYLRFNRPLTPALRIHRVREMNHQIADVYTPQPYAGPITVLRASLQTRRAAPDRTLGWGRYVSGEIRDLEIPGDHETIFHEPNVRVMAETLQSVIDRWLAEPK
ncbi:MAG: amino acid adenylation domain-containing protein [Chloroflexota bacterium]